MPYQSNRRRPTSRRRKKRYHIKPAPVIIAIILVVGLIIAVVWGMGKLTKAIVGEPSSTADSSSLNSSSDSSVDEPSDEPMDSAPSTNTSDIPAGGTATAGTALGGKAESSSASSDSSDSQPPSSPVAKKYGTIINSYNVSPVIVQAIENDPLWNLVLLNPGNKLEEEIPMKRVKVDDQSVDSRAYDSYKQMYDAALEAGHTLFLRSGYRSIESQRINYTAEINRQQKQLNKSKEEATKAAELYYTRPGHSEHHAGLAFDLITPEYHKNIYTLSEKFAETDAYKWLIENCASYGFILRYPKSKEEITQINFEPWHYRYVGVEHAKIIMSNNLCLEEYVAEMEGKFAVLHPDKLGTPEEHNAFAAFAIAYPANR